MVKDPAKPTASRARTQKGKEERSSEKSRRVAFFANISRELDHQFNVTLAVRDYRIKQEAVEEALRLWMGTDPAVMKNKLSEGMVTMAIPKSLVNTVTLLIKSLSKKSE